MECSSGKDVELEASRISEATERKKCMMRLKMPEDEIAKLESTEVQEPKLRNLNTEARTPRTLNSTPSTSKPVFWAFKAQILVSESSVAPSFRVLAVVRCFGCDRARCRV